MDKRVDALFDKECMSQEWTHPEPASKNRSEDDCNRMVGVCCFACSYLYRIIVSFRIVNPIHWKMEDVIDAKERSQIYIVFSVFRYLQKRSLHDTPTRIRLNSDSTLDTHTISRLSAPRWPGRLTLDTNSTQLINQKVVSRKEERVRVLTYETKSMTHKALPLACVLGSHSVFIGIFQSC
jgi:hypothetical protein